MRPLWLIEADAFGSAVEPLKTEIRRQGMNFSVIHHETFTSGYLPRIADENDCVLFIGTWPLWRHIQLHWSSWVPGGWCSTDQLDCAVYYQHLRDFVLNQKHFIMTGVEAIQRQEQIFAELATNGQVFVRPTGCLKVINGRCVDSASFASALAPTRYDPTTRIVAAQPKSIGHEWRVVVAEHRPLAASQYYDRGLKKLTGGCPHEVWQFVEQVLAAVAWEPDQVFVMDVCESEGKLYVLELNGFSCAGLYECDLTKVVSKASDLAERAWKATHELN